MVYLASHGFIDRAESALAPRLDFAPPLAPRLTVLLNHFHSRTTHYFLQYSTKKHLRI